MPKFNVSIDAPDSLMEKSKDLQPMDEAQLDNLLGVILQGHAQKKLNIKSASDQKKFADEQKKKLQPLVKKAAGDLEKVFKKYEAMEKQLKDKMGYEINTAGAKVVEKYKKAGAQLKPALKKDMDKASETIKKDFEKAASKTKK